MKGKGGESIKGYGIPYGEENVVISGGYAGFRAPPIYKGGLKMGGVRMGGKMCGGLKMGGVRMGGYAMDGGMGMDMSEYEEGGVILGGAKKTKAPKEPKAQKAQKAPRVLKVKKNKDGLTAVQAQKASQMDAKAKAIYIKRVNAINKAIEAKKAKAMTMTKEELAEERRAKKEAKAEKKAKAEQKKADKALTKKAKYAKKQMEHEARVRLADDYLEKHPVETYPEQKFTKQRAMNRARLIRLPEEERLAYYRKMMVEWDDWLKARGAGGVDEMMCDCGGLELTGGAWWNDIIDVATDFIPGGKLVKGAIKVGNKLLSR